MSQQFAPQSIKKGDSGGNFQRGRRGRKFRQKKDEEKKKKKKKKKRFRTSMRRINNLFPLPPLMRQRLFQKGNRKKLEVGETSKEEKGEDLDENDSSDEEVKMPIKKKPLVTPRKSVRLASKGKRPVVSLDDDSSTHTSHEPKKTTPSSPKPDTPPSQHIP